MLYSVKFFPRRSLSYCGWRQELELVSLEPEGKIVLTLKHEKHTYSELGFETQLSDRWSTKKLKKLEAEGLVEKVGRWYGLTKETEGLCL